MSWWRNELVSKGPVCHHDQKLIANILSDILHPRDLKEACLRRVNRSMFYFGLCIWWTAKLCRNLMIFPSFSLFLSLSLSLSPSLSLFPSTILFFFWLYNSFSKNFKFIIFYFWFLLSTLQLCKFISKYV